MAERLIDRGVQGSRVQKFTRSGSISSVVTSCGKGRVLGFIKYQESSLCDIVAALWFLAVAGAAPLFAASISGAEAAWSRTVRRQKKTARSASFLYQRENIECASKPSRKNIPRSRSSPPAHRRPRPAAADGGAARRKISWDICICGPTTPLAFFIRPKLYRSSRALLLPSGLMPANGGTASISTWMAKAAIFLSSSADRPAQRFLPQATSHPKEFKS